MGSTADTVGPPLIEDITETKGEVAATGATNSEKAPSSPAEDSISSQVKICGVCNEAEAKYKCSRPGCYLPYCSVACLKIHKPVHPLDPEPPSKPNVTVPIVDNTLPRPGTVAAAGYRGPFAALDDSKELQILFKKYPLLVSQLCKIHTATLPPTGKEESGFLQGMQQRGGKQESWNSERGEKKGLEALRKARGDGDGDGEGVREFSKLILHILSVDESLDAQEAVRKQIEEEERRVIETLLNQEMG